MKNVFVLVVDVVRDYEPIDNTIEVFEHESMAKKAFKKKVSEYKRSDKKNGFEIADDSETSYEAYEDGYAAHEHTYVNLYNKNVK